MKFPKILFIAILIIAGIFFIKNANADQDTISVFPMEHYDQTISTWIKPSNPNYDKPLLDAATQQRHVDLFYQHLFSPWDAKYVTQVLSHAAPDDIYTNERDAISSFSNVGKSDSEMGYGENFLPHTTEWINTIANNIDLNNLQKLNYSENNRAIATANLLARVLPTNDVHFYSYKIAGQGYPFDNLQMSSIWIGTPLYIIAESRDHAWVMVLAPDFIAWVPSEGVTVANPLFVDRWQKAAKKNLLAITHEQLSLLNSENKFLVTAYTGSVFPVVETGSTNKILVPVRDTNQTATTSISDVSKEDGAIIPLPMTPHNIANTMSTMIGRPYGWGNMYFYNDCSGETKNLLTAFGIWLPRHSSSQVNVGRMVDMTSASPEERLKYLMQNGKPFLNLIYIGGHVVMYIGNFPNPNSSGEMAMTYQDVWGLKPNPGIRRAVIGKSVLFPMLLQYPEDASLTSEAAKQYFQISYLDDLSTTYLQPQKINMKDLFEPMSI